MIDDRTPAAAPPVLFGHDVEERSCVTSQGRRVEIPLGSAHLGLCDVDFPDHRAKPHDTMMTTTMRMRSSDDEGFHSVPWNRMATLGSGGHSVSLRNPLIHRMFAHEMIHRIWLNCGLAGM